MTVTSESRLGWAPIAEVDPELWEAMLGERHRQHAKIELIASENYTFASVIDQLGDAVDLVLDGGRTPGAIPSTVVDVTVEPPAIRREGAIPAARIQELLGSGNAPSGA